MTADTLNLEILEARRTIERNMLILQLNEQSVAQGKDIAAKDAELAALKDHVATLTEAALMTPTPTA